MKNSNRQTIYLVCDTNPIKNFEQGTAEALPVVRIVDFRETEEGTFALPLCRCLLFNPMACNSEVTISITCLPCIACNIYCSANSLALYMLSLDEIKNRSKI